MTTAPTKVGFFARYPKWQWAVAALIGCGACGALFNAASKDDKTASAPTAKAVAVVPADTKASATDAPAATEASRCQPYDLAEAESLITNPDTGKRESIEGAILGAAVVRSKETVSSDAPLNAGLPIEFVAINVDGKVVMLAHAVGGLWSSVDEFSQTAAGFPLQNKWLKASMDTDGAREAKACAEAATP